MVDKDLYLEERYKRKHMRIWLINHYGVPPQYYPLARPTLFAKNLGKMGYEVIIFAASAVHNSDINLIEDGALYKKDIVDGVHYVYIRCSSYQENGLKRAVNILEFAERLPLVCKHFRKPDAVIATSFDPVSCYQGIRLAKKYNAKAVAEIADLWPETPVAYGMMKASSLVVKALRFLEKRIYTKADAIVFTMEGAYDYIIEQGWTNEIPRDKVFYINNGIDLEEFEYNRKNYIIDDVDLKNDNSFKVIYTGAIRKVNNLGLLLDTAKLVKNKNIKFLIWGDGDELDILRRRVEKEGIVNVVFKGKVDKKYIPYIISQANVNFAHGKQTSIAKYGLSLNKMFDYLAAGKMILTDYSSPYNPVVQCGAGIEIENSDAMNIANIIDDCSYMDDKEIKKYTENTKKEVKKYDFAELTKKLEVIINQI